MIYRVDIPRATSVEERMRITKRFTDESGCVVEEDALGLRVTGTPDVVTGIAADERLSCFVAVKLPRPKQPLDAVGEVAVEVGDGTVD